MDIADWNCAMWVGIFVNHDSLLYVRYWFINKPFLRNIENEFRLCSENVLGISICISDSHTGTWESNTKLRGNPFEGGT